MYSIIPIPTPEKSNLYEKKQRGIIICATGHSYYGMMAVRLAISIHVSDPKMPIALITEGAAYNWAVKKYSWLFDKIVMCPNEYLYVGDVRTDIKVKTYADILSPYNETILIDADTIWLGKKKPAELFDKMADTNLFFPCAAAVDINDPDIDKKCFAYFAVPSDTKKAYKFSSGIYYDLTSEFIYFKKKKVKQFFSTARNVFNKPKNAIKEFAGASYNEQIAFTVSLLINKINIDDPLFKPTYWSGWKETNKIYNFVELSNSHYILSVGGNKTPPHIRREYENLAKAYIGRIKAFDIPAILENKITHLPSRRND